MPKLVRVKILDSGAVKQMSEQAAERLTKANPKMYQMVEPPTIESMTLPPLPQKKSAEVAAEGNKDAPKSIGQTVPSNEKKPDPVTTTKTTEQALFKK